jgi:hypothetical protein
MALTSSTRAKRFLDAAFAEIAACDGRGVDPHWATPTTHPMADAKLLSAAATYARAGLISESGFARVCTEAAGRLAETALDRFGGLAWGLNFPWPERNAAADEPYLITTSLVAIGLCDAQSRGYAGANPLLDAALAALIGWPTTSSPHGPIPVYSPVISQPIVNTAAMWAVARLDAGGCASDDPGIRAVAAFLEANYLPGLGWRYGLSDNIIDLVHNAYTLQAVRRLFPDRFEAQAAALIGLLRSETWFDDKVRVVPAESVFELSPRLPFQIVGDRAIVRGGGASRSWSSGEILVTIADLADLTEHRKYWQGLLRLMLAEAVERLSDETADGEVVVAGDLRSGEGALNIRRLAHVMHGFARSLETIRRVPS